ncbi:MAG TPA: hypothetical protein VN749_14975 [Candidatus Eisenbacteria bacterium]|nr:hypothetical protein [Candidatus Eisenbacteria bacterium]
MMRRRNLQKLAILVAACGWLARTSAYAQDQQSSEPPKPPAKTYGPLGVDNQQEQNQSPDTYQPDTRPLTGFQQTTVGAPPERHSYWVPGVSYNNVIQSNGSLGGGQDSWSSTSYLNGNVSLLENWSRSQLQVSYSGGGYFSTDDGIGNGWFQQLGATQTFNWRRLQLVLLDEFGYLPQSQFGFGAGTGLSTPGVGGSLGGGPTGIGAGYSPGQSIFSAVGPRYFNTAGVQTTYQLSRRSSVTIGGLYSLLRFTEPGNIESDQYVGNVGYNYQITRSNTIGLQYRFSAFHYINDPQAIGDHIIQVAFGRKITRRLALTLSGGPEITNFRIAQTPTADTQHVAGSGGASLNYLVEKGSLTASYFHGITAGSGVFLGATTDQLTGSATRKVSRVWSGEIHAGYARNRSAETTQGVSSTDYDSFFGGVSAARPLGRNAMFNVSYTAFVERTELSGCTGSCSSSFTTNQISVGVSWHARPFVLR